MLESLLIMVTVLLLGFVTTLVSVPFCKHLAAKYRVVANPGGRKAPAKVIPQLGGAAVYLPFAILFASYYLLIMMGELTVVHQYKLQMISLFLGTTWILILGTIDDRYSMGWKKKIVGQLFGVAILVMGGHSLRLVTIPFVGPAQFGWLDIPLFALAILTITNAINLIDGLDGLAGGVCFFAALTSGIIAFTKGDLFIAAVAFTVSGSLLGFLRCNFPPASIYLGDGGSLMLGFLLGTLATSCAAISPGQRSGTMEMLIVPFLPFGLALLDVAVTVLRRWISGYHVCLGDSDHLHHRLVEEFKNPVRVVAIFYSFSAVLSGITLWMVIVPRSDSSSQFLVVVGIVLATAIVMVLRLYRIQSLSESVKNRPYFRFLSRYQDFMRGPIQGARCLDELVALLESGVKDLGLDRVEVLQHGRTIKTWSNSSRVHVGSLRSQRQRDFETSEVTVRWTVPTHKNKFYQKCLEVTWQRFLDELGSRLGKQIGGEPTGIRVRWNGLLAQPREEFLMCQDRLKSGEPGGREERRHSHKKL